MKARFYSFGKIYFGPLWICRILIINILLFSGPALSDTYYVNPSNPNASEGTKFGTNLEDIINYNYGTQSQPFGSINEAVQQIDQYALPGAHTIYVAPGTYRECVMLHTAENLTLIADTTGVHTGENPGEVIVTGAELIDTSLFIAYPNYQDVYYCTDVRKLDGTPLCPSYNECQTTCRVVYAVETNNPDTCHISYTEAGSISDMSTGNGLFYYEIDNTDPDQSVLSLCIKTFDGLPPMPDLGLACVLDVGNSSSYGYFKYRHSFDIETGGIGHHLEGFTCCYTWSYPIHVTEGSNTIKNNKIYMCDNNLGLMISANGTNSYGDIIISGNEIFHSSGIYVTHYANDIYFENNILHHNNHGIQIQNSSGTSTTVFIANNTLYGNSTNIRASGDLDLMVVNNTLSDSTIGDYDIQSVNGTGNFYNNNSFSTNYGTNQFQINEVGAISVNPNFRDPVNFDFHLLKESELIDAGTDITIANYTPPFEDKDGLTRTPAYNIGAYERIDNLILNGNGSSNLDYWNTNWANITMGIEGDNPHFLVTQGHAIQDVYLNKYINLIASGTATLTLRARMKADQETADDGFPYLYGYLMNSNGQINTYLKLGPVESSVWTEKSKTYSIPVGTTKLRLIIKLSRKANAAVTTQGRFDDIRAFID